MVVGVQGSAASGCDRGCAGASTHSAVAEETLLPRCSCCCLLLIAFHFLSSSNTKCRSQTQAVPDPACGAGSTSWQALARGCGAVGPCPLLLLNHPPPAGSVLAQTEVFRRVCKHPVPGAGMLAVLLSLDCIELLSSITH